MNKVVVLSTLFIVLAAGTSHSLAAENSFISYSLCKANIESVTMSSGPNGFYVNIQLTPTSASDFARFTDKNIGKKLSIFSGENKLVTAIIRAKIESGALQSSARPENAAKMLTEMLLNDAPESPCGSF